MVIDRKDPAILAPNARGPTRSSMFLAAVLRAGTGQAPVRVRNMSRTGAMIETPVTPAPGAKVALMRGALVAHGMIVWSSSNRCGVRFSSEVSVKDWLAAPNKKQQQRVDDMVALVKAGGSESHSEDTDLRGPRSQEQLVDDLGAVVSLLQNLEDDLAGSDETLARHAVKLQNLDIAMQMLRAVACELTPSRSEGSMRVASLEDLRASSSQALGGADK